MTRLTRPGLALGLLCLAAAGCTSGGTTTPSVTTPTTVTDTFSGTLFPNGAVSHQFAVLAAGTVTATITQLDGDTPPKIGLGLGTFDVTSGSCSTANGKYNDTATKFSNVTVTASGAGTLCARIYDSMGAVPSAINYEVQVQHP